MTHNDRSLLSAAARAVAILLIVGFVAALGRAPSASAEEASRDLNAEAFIRQGINRVLAVLKDRHASEGEKLAGLRDVFRNTFDHQTIGRFAAGPYFRRASAEERQAYLRALEEFLLAVYGARMLRYAGEIDLNLNADDIFAISGTDRISNGDIMVHTYINRADADRVAIDWRLRSGDEGLRVVDVVILNMSQVLVYRQEFTSVIRRPGSDLTGLTEVLEQRRASIMAEH